MIGLESIATVRRALAPVVGLEELRAFVAGKPRLAAPGCLMHAVPGTSRVSCAGISPDVAQCSEQWASHAQGIVSTVGLLKGDYGADHEAVTGGNMPRDCIVNCSRTIQGASATPVSRGETTASSGHLPQPVAEGRSATPVRTPAVGAGVPSQLQLRAAQQQCRSLVAALSKHIETAEHSHNTAQLASRLSIAFERLEAIKVARFGVLAESPIVPAQVSSNSSRFSQSELQASHPRVGGTICRSANAMPMVSASTSASDSAAAAARSSVPHAAAGTADSNVADDDVEDWLALAEQLDDRSLGASSVALASEMAWPFVSTSSSASSSRPSSAQLVAGGESPSRALPLPVELAGDSSMQQALAINSEVFGHRGFRDPQALIVKAALLNLDTFVLMPTGGGKSLCFQLPAALAPRGSVSLVISPLVSLIHDQVHQLRAVGVQAACLTGDMPQHEIRAVLSAMSSRTGSAPCLIYVTPERITCSDAFRSAMTSLHSRRLLARFVVDESHCVSLMGHDFREDYAKLSLLRRDYPGVPIMALTATATEAVVKDVTSILGMQYEQKAPPPQVRLPSLAASGPVHDPSGTPLLLFRKSFNRPNLRYSVVDKPKTKVVDVVVEMMKKYPGESGILYTLSRRDTEEMAKAICDSIAKPNAAVFYHAGLPSDVKTGNQQAWQAGRATVMVATIAFGMGINKPDTRWVVHASLPKSLANYYQESGRAGRDGDAADCVLVWRHADFRTQERMILDPDFGNKGAGGQAGSFGGGQAARRPIRTPNQLDSHARDRLAALNKMRDYARDLVTCRRKYVLGHFGEAFSPAACNGTCDNCERRLSSQQVNAAPAALGLLQLVRSCPRTLTTVQLVSAFRGVLKATNKAAQDRMGAVISHTQYGAGAIPGAATSFSKDECSQIVQQMLACRLLLIEDETNRAGYTTARLVMGSEAATFLHKPPTTWSLPLRRQGHVRVTGAAEAKMVLRIPHAHAAALERELRSAVAERLKSAAGGWTTVVSRVAVENASRDVPMTEDELATCEGWGRSRASKLAAVVLPLIRDYLQSRGLAPSRRLASPAHQGTASANSTKRPATSLLPAKRPMLAVRGVAAMPNEPLQGRAALATAAPSFSFASAASTHTAAAGSFMVPVGRSSQSPFFARQLAVATSASLGGFAGRQSGPPPPLS